MTDKVMITAHSGCEGTPDNSPESILKGIEAGADCIEIDIRMDPEGALWLTHNEIEDYSAALPLETAFRMIMEGGAAVNCDLKEENLLYPVLEAAEAAGIPREKLIFTGSVNLSLLAADPALVKRARFFLNMDQIFRFLLKGAPLPENWDERGAFFDGHAEAIAELVKRLGAEGINPSFKMMTPERLAVSHSLGIGLSLWTINEEEDQERFLREGLINMTTRNVVSAVRIRSGQGSVVRKMRNEK